MEWKEWIGKRIFVQLRSGSIYSGKVIDVDGDFFTMIDKFGEKVVFVVNEIIKIKEERE
jgi:hypothetical protein